MRKDPTVQEKVRTDGEKELIEQEKVRTDGEKRYDCTREGENGR